MFTHLASDSVSCSFKGESRVGGVPELCFVVIGPFIVPIISEESVEPDHVTSISWSEQSSRGGTK